MSKYSQEQLQAMANVAKRYRVEAPQAYGQMLLHIMMFTGLDQQ